MPVGCQQTGSLIFCVLLLFLNSWDFDPESAVKENNLIIEPLRVGQGVAEPALPTTVAG